MSLEKHYDRSTRLIANYFAAKLDKHFRFPSDNPYHIPLLDLALQADGYQPPMKTWGSTHRAAVWLGTINFYTDDHRFSKLIPHPEQFLPTQCRYAIEPNFSTDSDLDFLWNLAAIYFKRRCACYWQRHGIRIFVDLHVNTLYRDLNLLGVPPGWAAYANRAHRNHNDELLTDFKLATSHFRKGFPADAPQQQQVPLYLVFGGNADVAALCQLHGWFWVENSKG